ncbi:MAG: hypothetical protein SPJ07_00010 [Bacilli bacterium]|nr:hypothetical protein [Bacilli bacterium]
MKKKLLFLVAALALFVPSVMAAEKTAGTEEELTKALSEAATGDTIKLTDNITFSSDDIRFKGEKELTLDFNNHNLTGNGKTLIVENGVVTFTGKGTLDVKDSYVNVWGHEESTSKKKTVLNVDKDVTILGSTGIVIFYDVKHGAYNTEVNFAGTIKATNIGITTNGNILNENGPVVNIKKGATITATDEAGTGIYCAGNGTYNIEEGATITGGTGVEVRAGKLNVKGGTITGTAKELTSKANGGGTTTAGAGIAVVQHTTQLPIEVNITGGTITGAEALYVNNTQGNPTTAWAKVNVTVTGGTFSTDVTKFVADKYTINKTNNTYNVVENKVLETTDEKVILESEEALNRNYYLEVTAKDEEVFKKTSEKVTETYKDNKKVKDTTLIALYDINVVDGTQVVPMEDGEFTISISIPESMQKFDTYKVFYIDNDGKIAETLDAKLENGKVVFTTTHLSTYGVLGYNNVIEENPKTSDINLPAMIGLILTALFGATFALRKRLSKVNK